MLEVPGYENDEELAGPSTEEGGFRDTFPKEIVEDSDETREADVPRPNKVSMNTRAQNIQIADVTKNLNNDNTFPYREDSVPLTSSNLFEVQINQIDEGLTKFDKLDNSKKGEIAFVNPFSLGSENSDIPELTDRAKSLMDLDIMDGLFNALILLQLVLVTEIESV